MKKELRILQRTLGNPEVQTNNISKVQQFILIKLVQTSKVTCGESSSEGFLLEGGNVILGGAADCNTKVSKAEAESGERCSHGGLGCL